MESTGILNGDQAKLLVQLALADLLAALTLMFMSVLNKIGNVSVVICQYSLPLALSQCRKRMEALPVYPFVWLIPIVLYFAYVLTPFITTATLLPITRSGNGIANNRSKFCTSCILFLHIWKDSCSDPEKFHYIFIIVFLFTVVILALLLSSFTYYKVGKRYQRHKQEGLFAVEGDGRSRRQLKRMLSTARKMVIVILVCWLPGCLNSLVYAWGRRNFTEAVFGENTPLVSHERLAFFDESLRSSC
ncbi:hypothetical protein LDENG_00178050 [Lucifuga dentata]|nr:hypothetical protein LDENG_00178050 [Lucifuga dentata]